MEHGGTIIAERLAHWGIRSLFTLCGGHISPILVGAKQLGLQVVDARHEASAVFAADAAARLTGLPGAAAVTAGPGVTNTMTAVKNAQLAQSPVLILGGATATLLKGRGSLQDIDQLGLMAPVTKWATTVKRVAELGPTIDEALSRATRDVPGPVFVEVPVDLLYPEAVVREWVMKESGVANMKGLGGTALSLYLKGHLYQQFHAPRLPMVRPPSVDLGLIRPERAMTRVLDLLATAERPVLVIGSQALTGQRPEQADALAAAVTHLGLPTFLAGSARGLLGRHHPLQFRHKRSAALKAADLVVVAGFPFDFRLGYGRSIGRSAKLVAANLSAAELRQNRRPDVAIRMHAADFLRRLSELAPAGEGRWQDWFSACSERERARDEEIESLARSDGERVDPIDLFRRLEARMDDDAMLVVDGGDFVATAAYILRPRAPLSWLDPGVFGTLGVGGGFALGASACQPGRQLWLIYGDGSSAYSLAEFDTYLRHGFAPIAIIGTDASWAQIAREQVGVLGDDIGTVLLRTPYHQVAEGYGGVGLLLTEPARIDETLERAIASAREGKPVCINVHIASSDFRKGSISI